MMKYHLEMWNLNYTVMRAPVVANRPWQIHKKIHWSKLFNMFNHVVYSFFSGYFYLA